MDFPVWGSAYYEYISYMHVSVYILHTVASLFLIVVLVNFEKKIQNIVFLKN